MRRALTQIVAVLALVLFVAWIVHNVQANISRLGIDTGYAFLGREAGFPIIQALIPYSEASSYGSAILVGGLNTILLSVIGIVLATVLGFFIGLARLSSNWLLARLAGAYVELFRNLPLLVQIFFWYFAVLRPLPGPRGSLDLLGVAFLNNRGLFLPAPVVEPGFGAVSVAFLAACLGVWAMARWARRRRDRTGRSFPAFTVGVLAVVGVPLLVFVAAGAPLGFDVPVLRGFNYRGGLVVIPELVAIALALSIYNATYIAEIVRGGILAVPRGQVEAAAAIGLGRAEILRRVVLPQALRVIVPPLTNQYLNLAKASALAAAIAYPDLMHILSGAVLTQTGQAIEVMSIILVAYFAVSLLIAALMARYNRRTAIVGR